ncbi:MAG TPA: MOSC domain-containing protein [Acidimicrobiia bacterium]|nr:MOSC domain-containing protein [Acidimicrobiia bacterium]
MPSNIARLVSVNVGVPRNVEWFGRTVTTAIWKDPVAHRVAVRGVNVDGDDQADRRVHGGPDKAVYAYSVEDYAWWAGELGVPVLPGTFGENLTTEGIDLTQTVIGERWRVGTATLEVAQPRLPCFKLGIRMGDADFVEHFERAERPGAYLRIIDEGEVGAGDNIDVVARPTHGLTTVALASLQHDGNDALVELALSVESLPEGWRHTLEQRRARAARREQG